MIWLVCGSVLNLAVFAMLIVAMRGARRSSRVRRIPAAVETLQAWPRGLAPGRIELVFSGRTTVRHGASRAHEMLPLHLAGGRDAVNPDRLLLEYDRKLDLWRQAE